MINCTSLISSKYYTEVLRPIRQCVVYDKDEWSNNVTDHIDLLYIENETKLSCSIQQGIVYDEE